MYEGEHCRDVYLDETLDFLEFGRPYWSSLTIFGKFL